jgi:hypothetical protein
MTTTAIVWFRTDLRLHDMYQTIAERIGEPGLVSKPLASWIEYRFGEYTRLR